MTEAPSQDKPRPVTEHMEELVARLRICLATILIAALICFLIPSTFLPPLEGENIIATNSSDGGILKIFLLGSRSNSIVIYVLNKIRLDMINSAEY